VSGRLLICATAALVASSLRPSAYAQAQPAAGALTRDGSHDMDFAQGNWRTDIVQIKNPFDPNSPVTHMHGTKKVTPIWDGKGWLEQIEGDGPGGHWEAANVALYDPATHQWNNYYADSADGRLDSTPEVGEYRDGTVEFYSQQNVGGRVLLVRGVWKDIKPDSHEYDIARSIDGGRSWHTSFIARMTRMK
jgi:hypothetical protein